MKMLQDGKSVDEMRETIYDRFGNFGPSTDDLQKDSYLLPTAPAGTMLTNAPLDQCSETTTTCGE